MSADSRACSSILLRVLKNPSSCAPGLLELAIHLLLRFSDRQRDGGRCCRDEAGGKRGTHCISRKHMNKFPASLSSPSGCCNVQGAVWGEPMLQRARRGVSGPIHGLVRRDGDHITAHNEQGRKKWRHNLHCGVLLRIPARALFATPALSSVNTSCSPHGSLPATLTRSPRARAP